VPRNFDHWGDWVAQRARAVGIRRQKDLAEAVGCSEDQMSRWVQMRRPPARMRKGFDKSLARVLKTTPQKLFIDYATIAPEDASVEWGVPDPRNWPWHLKPDEWRERAKEQRASFVAFALGSTAEPWLQIGMMLIEAKQAADREEFEDAVLRGAVDTSHPSTPPLPLDMTKRAIQARRKKRKGA
jgi:hypothetical protein